MVTILGVIEGNKIYYDYDARKYIVKDMDIHGCTHTFGNDSLEDLVIHINKIIKCHKRKMRNKSVVFIGLMALISFVVGIIIFELIKDYTNALAIILSLFIGLTVTALVIIFDSEKKVEFKPYKPSLKEETKPKISKKMLRIIAIIFTVIAGAIIGGSIYKKKKKK